VFQQPDYERLGYPQANYPPARFQPAGFQPAAYQPVLNSLPLAANLPFLANGQPLVQQPDAELHGNRSADSRKDLAITISLTGNHYHSSNDYVYI
jgi:hypothetical protein